MSTSDLVNADENNAIVSFDELSVGADETQSRDIADKSELVGVPFVITAARFSRSEKGNGDFVSLEITTQDNRMLVVNDGSTGIRRQVVAYMTHKRWISPGEGDETGKVTRYDNPCNLWSFNDGPVEYRISDTGEPSAVVSPMRLLARKGLRSSTYNGPNGEATTYYLA